ETPCLLLSRALLEGQRVQRSTLAELENIRTVEPPSILSVGEVTRETKSDAVLPEMALLTPSGLEGELSKYIDPSTSALPQGGIARRSGITARRMNGLSRTT
ncbi:MAG TPA: hypothetical protein VF493_15645, partial [Terriglobales bacterium]